MRPISSHLDEHTDMLLCVIEIRKRHNLVDIRMPNSQIDGSTKLYLSQCTPYQWYDLQDIVVQHHGDVLLVRTEEKRIRRRSLNAVHILKVSFRYQLSSLGLLVEA